MLKEIIVFISPLVAGFFTTILIPIIVKRKVLKKLNEKIEENTTDLVKEVREVKKEILTMRGKIK